ncbi:MAG: hypothetical protein NC213_09310 [Acetobacter sp.]|nr:hypothetical protein [Bacteroides sp.]MCM1341928.1 hypothetical protein [Acetobacter sp.]MCM1434112.1 hypothetical protein [Clostridiales bacterium]
MLVNKKYYYDYGNILKKIFCYLIQFMINLFVMLALSFICFILMTSISTRIDSEIVTRILNTIICAVLIISALFFICFTFFPRNVTISRSYVKITKNAINTLRGKSWFSDIISFTSIVDCELFDKERTYRRDMFMRQNTYPFTFCNWNSIVKITDKYGNRYYFPVKNADDFIKEVTERVNIYRKEHGLEEI